MLQLTRKDLNKTINASIKELTKSLKLKSPHTEKQILQKTVQRPARKAGQGSKNATKTVPKPATKNKKTESVLQEKTETKMVVQ